MQEFITLIYIALGYWAHAYLTRNKIYIHSFGKLFLHRLILGTMFGIILIPIALIKLSIESKFRA